MPGVQSCLYIDSDPIDGIGYQIDIFEEWRRWGDSQLEYAAATRLQLDDRQTNALNQVSSDALLHYVFDKPAVRHRSREIVCFVLDHSIYRR